MSNVDLDKGGRLPQNVKTYLGPSLGWRSTDSPVDIEFVIEGGGAAPGIGYKGSLLIPDWLTIHSWLVFGNALGSIQVDIWKITKDQWLAGTFPSAADSITGTDKPRLVNAFSNSSELLTGWDTRINQNDVLTYNLESVTTLSNATVVLRCIRDLGQPF